MSTTVSASSEERLAGQRARRRWPWSFLLAGIVILAAVGYLIYANTQSNASYDLTVSQLRQCNSCTAQSVRVEGTVQKGSISHNDSSLSFIISDGSQGLPVLYSGVVPDIFNAGIQVVVEGHYSGQGSFQASTLLTKCPSKFTAATPTP
jgi:cytochrome c-type biogenesis protein CcmE